MTSTLEITDNSGDTKIEWNKNVAAEVDAARETFSRMKEQHKYLAYRLRRDGTQGEVIRSFDPDAERIVMVPQTVGG
jgi:hypothetical protein